MSSARNQYFLALVCASNVNRSVEAHDLFLKKGFEPNKINSYGSSAAVKLPGATGPPLTFPFNTQRYVTYLNLIEACNTENPAYYSQTGVLKMLQRDSQVKEFPESFQQTCRNAGAEFPFHLVITFEERVFADVCEFIGIEVETKGSIHRVFVINVDTPDSIDGAKAGAEAAFHLCSRLEQAAVAEWGTWIPEQLAEINREREKAQQPPYLHAMFVV